MRLDPRATSLAALLAVTTLGAPARADLGEDVSRIRRAWGNATRLEPRFLERGDLRPLLLPRDALGPGAEECTTVVVLGSLTTTFVLRFLPSRGALYWPEGEHPELSIAGAAQLVRCGARRAMLERLAVEMRSPRGVVEVLVARGPRPFPPLLRTLTERDPGPIAPLGVSGPRPVSAPLTERLRAIDARAAREGAAATERRWFRATRNGSGQVDVRASEGCYRLDLLGAPVEDPTSSVDLDADLVAANGAETIASDHTENSDASLEFCAGSPRVLELQFAGALPELPIVLSTTRWELPAGLPSSWEAERRASMAEALRQHRGPRLLGTPVYSSLGVSGVTLLPLELEPGSCYLGAVSAIRGEPSGVALSVEVGPHQAENRALLGKAGTLVSFCARGQTRALVDVEARGAGVSWLFGLWRTGRLLVGEVAE